MAEAHWKRHERKTARLLGAERNPNTGRSQADITAGPFCVEHKSRKVLPKWLLEALEQARRNAAPGQTPVVVLSWAPGQGRKVQRYVMLRFEDWAEWHGAPGGRGDAISGAL